MSTEEIHTALGQIQLTLVHSSTRMTEQYMGVEQNLTQAPCDVLELELQAKWRGDKSYRG